MSRLPWQDVADVLTRPASCANHTR